LKFAGHLVEVAKMEKVQYRRRPHWNYGFQQINNTQNESFNILHPFIFYTEHLKKDLCSTLAENRYFSNQRNHHFDQTSTDVQEFKCLGSVRFIYLFF